MSRYFIILKGAFTLTLCLFLAGCMNKVGYGASHEITMANSKSVTIVYDPLMGGDRAQIDAATQHCQKYGKEPIPTIMSYRGILPQQTYVCQ